MWKCIRLNLVNFLGIYFVAYHVVPGVYYAVDLFRSCDLVMYYVSYLLQFLFCIILLLVYWSTLLRNPHYFITIASRIESRLPISNNPQITTARANTLAQNIHESVIVVAFLIVTTPLYYIPWIGPILYFFYCCWLYSFYCFTYTWNLRPPNLLTDKITYFEFHWLYFIGFGTPFSIVLWYLPLTVSLAVYSVLFPLFVAMALASKPKRPSPKNDLIPHQVAIFHEALWFTHKSIDYGTRIWQAFN